MLFAQNAIKPTHFYAFDGNVQDAGLQAVHGEANNIQFDSGYTDKPQTAVLFSDTNQYITLPLNLNPMEKGTTVSFWMYPEKQQKKRFLLFFQRENGKSSGWQIAYQAYGGGGWAELWDLTNSGFIDENQHFRGYPDRKYGKGYDRWHHVAMTFTPNQHVQFYLNGILIHTSQKLEEMGNFDSQAPIILGNYSPIMPEKTHKAFKGKIDNVQLFDFAISLEQVRELYFQELIDLKHEWTLSQDLLKEKMRNDVYARNRKEGKPDNHCFFNSFVRMNYIMNPGVSQFIGERRFRPEHAQLLYDESTQRLEIVFPDSDTIIFDKIRPEDFHMGKFELHNPKFGFTDSDSVQLQYLEIRNNRTGKRYISEDKLPHKKLKTFIPKLENLSDKLEIGLPSTHLNVPIPNLYFETGKDSLVGLSYVSLDKVVSLLKTYPELHIDISGHTDNKGDFQANLTLSVSRAKAVKDYFVEKGIDEKRLQFGGYGSAKPVRSNGSAEGRKLNRRVEIQVLDKEGVQGSLTFY